MFKSVAAQRTGLVRAPQVNRSCVTRKSLVVRAGVISSNDLRNGVCLEVEGKPYKVVEFLHVKPGKGAAFVRTKVKNCITGGVVEMTFRGGEPLNTADVQKREAQYTYNEGEEYIFMDQESYEELRLKKDDWAKYLKEGAICEVMFYNGNVISVDPPTFVELKVVECPPNVKGNTQAGGSKPATLETGAVLQVPLFVESGDTLKIDTRTDTYLSRV